MKTVERVFLTQAEAELESKKMRRTGKYDGVFVDALIDPHTKHSSSFWKKKKFLVRGYTA